MKFHNRPAWAKEISLLVVLGAFVSGATVEHHALAAAIIFLAVNVLDVWNYWRWVSFNG